MTIHLTWHAVWAVGKYLLTFGAGVAVGAGLVLRGFADSIGRAF